MQVYYDNTTSLFFTKICIGCGTKQTKNGECWDANKCGNCFNSESLCDIENYKLLHLENYPEMISNLTEQQLKKLTMRNKYFALEEMQRRANILDNVLPKNRKDFVEDKSN